MADIVLAGQLRTLKFDVHALSELELRAEKHLGWFLNELAERRCGPAVARWLLWAGLQHETPRPSLAAIDALLVSHVAAGGNTFDVLGPAVIALTESNLLSAKRATANPQ